MQWKIQGTGSSGTGDVQWRRASSGERPAARAREQAETSGGGWRGRGDNSLAAASSRGVWPVGAGVDEPCQAGEAARWSAPVERAPAGRRRGRPCREPKPSPASPPPPPPAAAATPTRGARRSPRACVAEAAGGTAPAGPLCASACMHPTADLRRTAPVSARARPRWRPAGPAPALTAEHVGRNPTSSIKVLAGAPLASARPAWPPVSARRCLAALPAMVRFRRSNTASSHRHQGDWSAIRAEMEAIGRPDKHHPRRQHPAAAPTPASRHPVLPSSPVSPVWPASPTTPTGPSTPATAPQHYAAADDPVCVP